MDTSLMPYFLSAFFISIGFCINIFSAKGGGKLLFLYWLLCAFLGLCQNLIAVFLSILADTFSFNKSILSFSFSVSSIVPPKDLLVILYHLQTMSVFH